MAEVITSSETPTLKPLRTVIDVNVGESHQVTLVDGRQVIVRILAIDSQPDELRQAIRAATVQLEVDGQALALAVANYNLPVTIAGVQIDCPVTRDYYKNCMHDWWGLDKDARLRLWPAKSPLVAPGTFVYPMRQRWFAGDTQMDNEMTVFESKVRR